MIRRLAWAAPALLLAGFVFGQDNGQPLCCSWGWYNSVVKTAWGSHAPGDVQTTWDVTLTCSPQCGSFDPCCFCLQEYLSIWGPNGWQPAPNSTTGTGYSQTNAYRIACGPDVPEHWFLDWGGYPAGTYQMYYYLNTCTCTQPACQFCSVGARTFRDFTIAP
jgi:hypothetical protein